MVMTPVADRKKPCEYPRQRPVTSRTPPGRNNPFANMFRFLFRFSGVFSLQVKVVIKVTEDGKLLF